MPPLSPSHDAEVVHIHEPLGEQVLKQVTPDIIAEIGDISVGTATTFIKERVHLFRKVKRGLYEIRDPKADREAEA